MMNFRGSAMESPSYHQVSRAVKRPAPLDGNRHGPQGERGEKLVATGGGQGENRRSIPRKMVG